MPTLPSVAQRDWRFLRDTRVVPSLYGGLKRWKKDIDGRLKVSDHYRLDDRRRSAPVLVCMLAGYKAVLWPFVMPRFKAALPDADVCLVSPGLRNQELAKLCEREGWSYLSTATNDVSLAQNVCYRLHANAEIIVKLDEDMFLLPNSLAALVSEYRRIKAEGVVNPGFVAPMIPINGFCYRRLLDVLGLREEFERKFGPATLACSGIAIQNDPTAARWMWEKTAPLEATAKRLAHSPRETLLCPIQFSIGAIAFERGFWELIGRLPVFRRRLMVKASTLGGDEEHICAKAVTHSRPGVVTTSILAGHFSFGPQYEAMKTMLASRPDLFEPSV